MIEQAGSFVKGMFQEFSPRGMFRERPHPRPRAVNLPMFSDLLGLGEQDGKGGFPKGS